MTKHHDMTLPGETQVVVAGDWHGNFNWASRALSAIGQTGDGIRTVLHAGDFGLWPDHRGRGFITGVDFICERVGIERILVTPGNHEDWNWLDADFAAMPGEPVPVSDRISVLPRGYRFTLGGTTLLSFGGAASVDYAHRTTGHDWFITEVPTEADVAHAIAGGHVDVLLTHDTVNGGTAATERVLGSNPMGWSAEALHYSAGSRKLVTDVWEATAARLLLHGHMHVPDEVTLTNDRRVISLGRDTQARNLGVLHLGSLDWRWMDEFGASGRVSRTLNIESQYLTRPGETSTGEDGVAGSD